MKKAVLSALFLSLLANPPAAAHEKQTMNAPPGQAPPAANIEATQSIQKPISLKTMGSLFFGGSVSSNPARDTFHGDHGYAQFYIPVESRNYPLILWHGLAHSGSIWESTPDGREGFQAIPPRRGWSVYIIDQPSRGRAGRTASPVPNIFKDLPTARESGTWTAYRNGIWIPPNNASLFPHSQFPGDAASIEQFFRRQTPATGEEPRTNKYRAEMAKTFSSLLDRTGPAILLTHSNSGQYGWFAGMESPDRIKGIVAYEPAQFVFPEDEPIPDAEFKNIMANEFLRRIPVPLEEFKKLTRMPIMVVYGDNISQELSESFYIEASRIAKERAVEFVNAINRHGGDASIIILPEAGIKGNTHAPFADANNLEIAALLEQWLHDKGLARRDNPHAGPLPVKNSPLTIPLLNGGIN